MNFRIISQTELDEIIERHQHWLDEDVEGWEHMRADLSYCTLVDLDFSNANLSGINFRFSILSHSQLNGCNLSFACLYGANLAFTKLEEAKLTRANLAHADLNHADLASADLRKANLYRTNLWYTTLDNADLKFAYCDFANVDGVDLSVANNVPYIPMACPDTGSFIGYKKAEEYIVKLEIPESAQRSSATGRKCRCDKAKVLEIQNLDGTKASVKKVCSGYDEDFIYKVGEIVSVPNFDTYRFNECAPGIHFFINRQEAVDYK